MVRKPVTIRNSMDMEMRPIAHLVQEASQYKSRPAAFKACPSLINSSLNLMISINDFLLKLQH